MDVRPTPRPPRVTLVLALCAALGATGFSLGLGMVLSWREPLPPTDVTGMLPQAPAGEEEAWAAIEATFGKLGSIQDQVVRRARPVVNALAGVNVLASAALLLGALAARMRATRGLDLLRTGLVLSQGYAFLAVLVHTWLQLQLFVAYRNGFLPLLGQGGSVRDFALAALISQALATVVWAGFYLAQLIFYVWAQRWSRRPAVRKALAPPQS